MNGTMKAGRLQGTLKTHARDKVVTIDEVPIPKISAGEVLIRVLRAGLNHGDLHMREDSASYMPGVQTVEFLPMTLGHDGMGEIVEIGPGVTNVRMGDRVIVMCSITCGFCRFCRTERQHLCVSNRVMGFIAKWGEKGSPMRYKDGLWAEYCRVPATNVLPLQAGDDLDAFGKVAQIAIGYRALKRSRLHSGETVIVNGASGIAGIGTVLSALAMGAAHVVAVARNPERLAQIRAIDPRRITTVALARGEKIGETVREVTRGEGANVVADLAPQGVQSLIDCIGALEGGGRVTLLSANPEPLNLPVRYLMIRSIEITSVTGRYYTDIPEIMELVRTGLIDTHHVTTRHFPIEALNEALDYIETRKPPDPIWPMYSPTH